MMVFDIRRIFKNVDQCKRSFEEYLTDQLLLLYLINKAEEKGKADGILKIIKLVFISELQALKRGFMTFNYNMYKWGRGPYDDEVQVDVDYLVENGLLETKKDGVTFKLTKEGEKILAVFGEHIPKQAVQNIDWTCEKFSKLNAFVLQNKTHQFKIELDGETVKIDDLPNDRFSFIFRDYLKNNPKRLHIDDSILDDFEFSINKQSKENLDATLGHVSEGGHNIVKRFTPL